MDKNEELGNRYTQALAQAMMNTKQVVIRNLMETKWSDEVRPFETEVKFDDAN